MKSAPDFRVDATATKDGPSSQDRTLAQARYISPHAFPQFKQ